MLFDSTLDPPTIAFWLLPEPERELGSLLNQNLTTLRMYVGQLRDAVNLLDFFDANCPRPTNADEAAASSDMRRQFGNWKILAGRDAAVTIKNYATTHQTIDKQAAKLPSIKDRRNYDALAKARDCFKSAFASHDAIRTAVAHGDLNRSAKEAANHRVPGTGLTVGVTIKGREISTSAKGDMRPITLTQDAVAVLEEVTGLIYEGYRPAHEFSKRLLLGG